MATKYAALKHDPSKTEATYLRTAKTRGPTNIHVDIRVNRFYPGHYAKVRGEYSARACFRGNGAFLPSGKWKERRCEMGFGKSPTQAVRIALRKLSSKTK